MKNPNAQIVDFLALEGVASKTVASTGVVYLYSYPVEMGASYSFEYQFSSGAAVDVKLELEQSNELLTAAEEGASNANYVVPEDASTFDAQVNDKLVHIKAYIMFSTHYAFLSEYRY